MHEPFPSISVLIPDLKSGDYAAWNDLCEKFRIGLTSKARLLVKSSSQRNLNAEDLVQETFMKAWNARDSFRGRTTSRLAKWLLTILNNTFLDQCRRKDSETSAPTWFGFQGKDATASQAIISVEQEANLHASLAELDSNTQLIINLRIFEGLKFSEIAAETNSNIHTVASAYRRGIQRVYKLVAKHHESRVIPIREAQEPPTGPSEPINSET